MHRKIRYSSPAVANTAVVGACFASPRQIALVQSVPGQQLRPQDRPILRAQMTLAQVHRPIVKSVRVRSITVRPSISTPNQFGRLGPFGSLMESTSRRSRGVQSPHKFGKSGSDPDQEAIQAPEIPQPFESDSFHLPHHPWQARPIHAVVPLA